MLYVVYNMNHIYHWLNEPKKLILLIFKNGGSSLLRAEKLLWLKISDLGHVNLCSKGTC